MSAQLNKKKKKHCKPTHFNEKWLKAYGLHVSARDAATGDVASVEYVYEAVATRSHEEAHAAASRAIKEYLSLSVSQKTSYFDPSTAGARKEDSPKGRFFLPPPTNDEQLKIWPDKAIVEGIIGNLLFDPDDDEEISTKERFLSVFKLQDDDEALDDNPHEEEENAGLERYLATVRSKLQFYSCIKMVSSGLSFRQVSKVMQDMKETLRLATLGSMSPQKVSSYVRIACAANLQTISAILKDSWAFSIALDGGNKSDTSYLDVRLRVVSNHGVLLNLHLLAIPMRERHTGEHMFELVSTALDNLSP
ncbi:hypothetical protein MHU86_16421 [Fragilaria crotonensis]|nr:hypothetical protein MHU86_16421 [Fragilaria crotonensis]